MRFGWLIPVFLCAATLLAGEREALLDKYCLDCHDSEVKKGTWTSAGSASSLATPSVLRAGYWCITE